MFKFIFRIMVTTVFLLFMTIVLALWKGGEPFRVFGEGVIIVGRTLVGFGEVVDNFIGGGKKLHRSYDEIREVLKEEDPGKGPGK